MGRNLNSLFKEMDILSQLRSKIDTIDTQIIDLISKRFSIVADIWAYKKNHNIPILDGIRRSKLLQSNIIQGEKRWLSKDFIVDVRKKIHKETLKIQK